MSWVTMLARDLKELLKERTNFFLQIIFLLKRVKDLLHLWRRSNCYVCQFIIEWHILGSSTSTHHTNYFTHFKTSKPLNKKKDTLAIINEKPEWVQRFMSWNQIFYILNKYVKIKVSHYKLAEGFFNGKFSHGVSIGGKIEASGLICNLNLPITKFQFRFHNITAPKFLEKKIKNQLNRPESWW